MNKRDAVRKREGKKEWRCPDCDSDVVIKDRLQINKSHWVQWGWCGSCNRRLRIDKYGVKCVEANGR
jgi:hypothetical protein